MTLPGGRKGIFISSVVAYVYHSGLIVPDLTKDPVYGRPFIPRHCRPQLLNSKTPLPSVSTFDISYQLPCSDERAREGSARGGTVGGGRR